MSLSFVKSAVLSSTDGISHNEEIIIDNRETQSLRAAAQTSHPQTLFEQLRANKDAELEKDEEYQKSLRGMRPLDEEDCAHLDAVERRRAEQEHIVRSGVEWEVAMFRAAKKHRELVQTVIEEEEEEERGIHHHHDKDGHDPNENNRSMLSAHDVVEEDSIEGVAKKVLGRAQPIIAGSSSSARGNIMTGIVPKFTIKKKRKRLSQESIPCSTYLVEQNADAKEDPEALTTRKKECKNETFIEAGIRDEGITTSSTNEAVVEKEDGGLLGLGFYGSDSD